MKMPWSMEILKSRPTWPSLATPFYSHLKACMSSLTLDLLKALRGLKPFLLSFTKTLKYLIKQLPYVLSLLKLIIWTLIWSYKLTKGNSSSSQKMNELYMRSYARYFCKDSIRYAQNILKMKLNSKLPLVSWE